MILSQDETVHFELEEDFEMDYPKSKYGWATHRIPFTQRQWLYLLVGQGVVPAIINFLLNLFLTWAMYPKTPGEMITFAGKFTQCIFTDIIVTCFVLCFISTVLGSVLITFDLRKGKMVQPVDERWLNHPWLTWIPLGIFWKTVLKRAVFFGAFGVLIFAPFTLITTYLAVGSEGIMIKWGYCLYKAFFTAILAFIVSPFIAFIMIASYNPRNTFFNK
ncbi:hypothetical protein CYY_001166 [Polysphondylium violaceum]|uniref:Transmembrane protein n=1 Tax=Polysphondylium violaceum TaxID=133409 RepID=A0A8J4V4T6_9MYCE|nr:hypothetical protein CYY_001166 [Polysphondylium violaceum]